MAIVSSHLLSSTDGSHASGVKVIINQIKKMVPEKKSINPKQIKMEGYLKNFHSQKKIVY